MALVREQHEKAKEILAENREKLDELAQFLYERETITGILLILLGLFTLIRPTTVLTWAVLIYGLLAVLTGIADVVFYAKAERYLGIGPTFTLVGGILGILAGMTLMLNPGVGGWTMTLFFPLWFIAHSVSQLACGDFLRWCVGGAASRVSTVLNILGLLLGCAMLVLPWLSVRVMTSPPQDVSRQRQGHSVPPKNLGLGICGKLLDRSASSKPDFSHQPLLRLGQW